MFNQIDFLFPLRTNPGSLAKTPTKLSILNKALYHELIFFPFWMFGWICLRLTPLFLHLDLTRRGCERIDDQFLQKTPRQALGKRNTINIACEYCIFIIIII